MMKIQKLALLLLLSGLILLGFGLIKLTIWSSLSGIFCLLMAWGLFMCLYEDEWKANFSMPQHLLIPSQQLHRKRIRRFPNR